MLKQKLLKKGKNTVATHAIRAHVKLSQSVKGIRVEHIVVLIE
jgi:hypothetical protein